MGILNALTARQPGANRPDAERPADLLIERQGSKSPRVRWVKGMPSPNPGGRPATPREITEGYRSLAPLALQRAREILEDPESKPADTLKAIELVNARAYGAPQQRVELAADVTTNLEPGELDLSRLTPAQIQALREIHRAALPGEVVDGEATTPAVTEATRGEK